MNKFKQCHTAFHWLSLTSYRFGDTFLKSFVSFSPGGQKILWKNMFVWFTIAELCGFLFLHLQMSLTAPNYTFSSPFLPRIRQTVVKTFLYGCVIQTGSSLCQVICGELRDISSTQRGSEFFSFPEMIFVLKQDNAQVHPGEGLVVYPGLE